MSRGWRRELGRISAALAALSLGTVFLVMPVASAQTPVPVPAPTPTPTPVLTGTGYAEGTITNGTEGGHPAGLEVTVQVFFTMNQIDEKKAMTDAAGHFRVDGLPNSPSNRYIISVTFDGVKYTVPSAINPTASEDPVALTVYRKTEAPDAVTFLSASAAMTSIDATTGLIQMLEVITVENNSKLAFIGDLLTNPDQGGVLRVPLMGPGLDLQLGDGFGTEGVLATPTKMITRTPLFPGETVLVFDYKLPYDQQSVTLTRNFPYPVDNASFVLSAKGPKAASAALSTRKTVTIDQLDSVELSGKSFQPGQDITVDVTGLPAIKPAGSSSTGMYLRMGGVALAAAAIVAIGVYAWLARRKRNARVEIALSEMESLEAQRRDLVESLAALDRRFEAGGLAQQEYDQTKAGLRQKLTDVAMLIQERSAPVS